ncbi:olfactory receptor 2G3-like [Gastrophryne carolinensis]
MDWKNNTAIKEFVLLGLSNIFTVNLALFITFLNIYLIVLVANSLIIVCVVTDKKLHTPMYYFLSNLSLVDICLSSSIIPRTLQDMLATRKTISLSECVAQLYISLSLGNTECLLVTVLAYDRYIAICFPLHYTTIINSFVCMKITAGIWTCGFVLPVIHIFFMLNIDLCGHNVINHFFCETPEILALGCGRVRDVKLWIYACSAVLLITPITFIVITYVNIIKAIFKISSSAGRKKSFSTCSSHIIVVTMFYGSTMATYMRPESASLPNVDKLFAIFSTILTPALNPLVYTLRNKEVQSALKGFQKFFKSANVQEYRSSLIGSNPVQSSAINIMDRG